LLRYELPYSYWKPYCGYSPAESRLVFTVGTPIKFSIGRYIEPVSMPEQTQRVLPVRADREEGLHLRRLSSGVLGRPSGGSDAGSSRQGVLNEDVGRGEGAIRRTLDDSGGEEQVPWSLPQRQEGKPVRKWFIWGDRHGHVELLDNSKASTPERVVLVEDLISAHKVAQVYPCIPLFGTNVSDVVVKKLQALKLPVTLWLDEDQYTLLPKKINRLQTFLEAPVGYIYTGKDPKEFSVKEIKEILNGQRST
jgi:hypothetical protein